MSGKFFIRPTLLLVILAVMPAASASIPALGSLFVVDRDTNRIVELDVDSGTELHSFPAPAPVYKAGLATSGSELFFATPPGTIYVLDPGDGSILNSFPSPVEAAPFGVSGLGYGTTTFGDTLFGLSNHTESVLLMDPTTGRLLTSFSAPIDPVTGFPINFADGFDFNPSTGTIFVGDFSVTDTIYELDAVTGALLNSFAAPGGLVSGIGFVGDHMFAVDRGTDLIYELDPLTGTVLDSFHSGVSNPFGMTGIDTSPPILTVPEDVDAECTDPGGQPVDIGMATAFDHFDAAPAITNDAPAVFPPGTTIVTWTATDATGNSSTDTQGVTVSDTTDPELVDLQMHPNPVDVTETAQDVTVSIEVLEECALVSGTFTLLDPNGEPVPGIDGIEFVKDGEGRLPLPETGGETPEGSSPGTDLFIFDVPIPADSADGFYEAVVTLTDLAGNHVKYMVEGDPDFPIGSNPFLQVVAVLRPPNDQLANAFVLSGASAGDSGTNANATSEPNEAPPTCVAGIIDSVWWTWRAPNDGFLEVDTFGSGFDTILAAFTGTGHPLTEIACNDDFAPGLLDVAGDDPAGQGDESPETIGPNLESHIELFVNQGVTYYFAVYVRGGSGTISLNLRLNVEPGSPESTLAEWAGAYGLEGPEANPDADPDEDGVSNLYEAFTGTDPTRRASASRAAFSLEDGYLTLTVNRGPYRIAGLKCDAEAVDEHKEWHGSSTGETVILVDSNSVFKARDALPVGAVRCRLLRLAISLPDSL